MEWKENSNNTFLWVPYFRKPQIRTGVVPRLAWPCLNNGLDPLHSDTLPYRSLAGFQAAPEEGSRSHWRLRAFACKGLKYNGCSKIVRDDAGWPQFHGKRLKPHPTPKMKRGFANHLKGLDTGTKGGPAPGFKPPG